MNVALKEYQELLDLTKEYLLQEYPKNEFLSVNAPTFHYFSHYSKTENRTIQTKGPSIRSEIKPANNTPSSNIKPSPSLEIKKTAEIQPKIDPSKVIPIASPASPLLPAKAPESKKPGSFKMEPMDPAPAIDFTVIKSLMKEHFPNVQILDVPPSDATALAINNGWQAESRHPTILIILGNETAKCRQLAENICKAIERYEGQASLISAMDIEQSGHGWDNFIANEKLKLVVVSTDIRALPRFNKLCTKQAEQDFFGKARIVHFDIARCLVDPMHKANLWLLARGAIEKQH